VFVNNNDTMAKKTVTAYFVFSEEKRAEAREECLQGALTQKVSAAIVAKKIGGKWRALPEEEKIRCSDFKLLSRATRVGHGRVVRILGKNLSQDVPKCNLMRAGTKN
jgi:HMG (high mobility group) box